MRLTILAALVSTAAIALPLEQLDDGGAAIVDGGTLDPDAGSFFIDHTGTLSTTNTCDTVDAQGRLVSRLENCINIRIGPSGPPMQMQLGPDGGYLARGPSECVQPGPPPRPPPDGGGQPPPPPPPDGGPVGPPPGGGVIPGP